MCPHCQSLVATGRNIPLIPFFLHSAFFPDSVLVNLAAPVLLLTQTFSGLASAFAFDATSSASEMNNTCVFMLFLQLHEYERAFTWVSGLVSFISMTNRCMQLHQSALIHWLPSTSDAGVAEKLLEHFYLGCFHGTCFLGNTARVKFLPFLEGKQNYPPSRKYGNGASLKRSSSALDATDGKPSTCDRYFQYKL